MLFAVLPYALVLYGAYATYITMAATDPVIFRLTFGGISVTCIAMVRESCLPPFFALVLSAPSAHRSPLRLVALYAGGQAVL